MILQNNTNGSDTVLMVLIVGVDSYKVIMCRNDFNMLSLESEIL